MFRFAMPMLGAAALSLVGLTALPVAAQTVCNAETMAGVWITGHGVTSCRINLRENGRFRGSCTVILDYDQHGNVVTAEVENRGRITVQSNCQVFGPLFVRNPETEGEIRSVLRGYAWGGDVPMAMHLVSVTDEAPGGWTFVRRIEFEDD